MTKNYTDRQVSGAEKLHYTIAADMFPRKAIASVIGIGGMAGAAAGMIIAKVASYILQCTRSYRIPF